MFFSSEYSREKVNTIIDRFYNDVRHLYNDLYQFPPSDLIYYDNRTLHSHRGGGHFVCESSVQYLRHGWAQNLHGEWVAVINTDKFPQSIRVETCRYKDKRCEYLPPCYKSICVQRYNYVKLLCLDPYRPTYRPTVDVFKVPSACSCFVEDFTYY
ncbi:LOW QUALITY PROTEIN: neurotrophin 1-like [Palaemon carinicauda]|uniref:LOW QUALITY PROTEIN: neurotrophin 1-like n=1 Tax=Palaemon carinicauda TaxID=392227 RepID=UPI0035B5BFEB